MSALYRLIARLGLRWLVAGAVVRFVARRLGRATVERAGRDLEASARDRLPEVVARRVPPLPPDVVQAGGSAVVAGRAVRGAVVGTRRAGRAASEGRRHLGTTLGLARTALDQVRTESERSARDLRSQYLEATEGRDAATDALLDARRPQRNVIDGLGVDDALDDPHDSVPDPVATGRRRYHRRPRPVVGRMSRRYRPPVKPWE